MSLMVSNPSNINHFKWLRMCYDWRSLSLTSQRSLSCRRIKFFGPNSTRSRSIINVLGHSECEDSNDVLCQIPQHDPLHLRYPNLFPSYILALRSGMPRMGKVCFHFYQNATWFITLHVIETILYDKFWRNWWIHTLPMRCLLKLGRVPLHLGF